MIGPFCFFDHLGPVDLPQGLAREPDGQSLEATQLVVFSPGAEAVIQATVPTVLMLLGGATIAERFIEWNFVSSSRERIAQANASRSSGLCEGDCQPRRRSRKACRGIYDCASIRALPT